MLAVLLLSVPNASAAPWLHDVLEAGDGAPIERSLQALSAPPGRLSPTLLPSAGGHTVRF